MKNFIDYEIIIVPEKEEILAFCNGSNHKKLLAVYEASEQEDALKDFLAKILKAVHYDIEKDILLVKLTPEQHFSLALLCQEKDIEHCISFGVPPKRLGLQIQVTTLYQAFKFRDIVFVFAHSLSDIQTNSKWKGLLWKQLQDVFLRK